MRPPIATITDAFTYSGMLFFSAIEPKDAKSRTQKVLEFEFKSKDKHMNMMNRLLWSLAVKGAICGVVRVFLLLQKWKRSTIHRSLFHFRRCVSVFASLRK